MTSAPGQRQASGEPAQAFLPALRRFFLRRVPSDHVDDLVQDVFTNLQARKSATLIDNNEAYLFAVARNVLANYWRSNFQHATNAELTEAAHVRDPWPLADQQLVDRESLNRALQAIEGMPERTRNIFLMHRFEDMTYAEIARAAGISVSAVEKHIMAALHILLRATGRGR